MTDKAEQLRAGLTAIWARSLPHIRAQLDVLDQMAIALREGTLTPELRGEGEREAHRLAGSGGSFGFHEASRIARELEHMLHGTGALDARAVSERVVALRGFIDTEKLP
jgi:HPt (histidine-containing phosphotransfer) domain-containing protein